MVLLVCSSALLLLGVSAEPSWAEFKDRYQRHYDTDEEEHNRFAIFIENVKIITEVNSQGLPYWLGVNHLTDWTQDEYKGLRGLIPGHFPVAQRLGNHSPNGVAPPASIDWVSKGAVTPVKNQGQCGSCWSFSSTGGLEGAWQLATGHLVSFSEQELVDCSHNGNNGCNGGLMDNSFTWWENQNVCTESGYAAYSASDGSCRLPCSQVGVPKGGVKGYTDVSGGENGLLSAVAERPVSIGVDAAGSNWQMYSGGVMTSECGQQLDHGVLAVGYGKDGANLYWKVKNSWGTNWGEAGYIRIVRGRNSCGIANGASYPHVDGNVPPAPPTPPTPPSPTPTPPSPGCKDDFPECSSWPCEFFANVCRKHCGCCGPNPPSNCEAAPTTSDAVV